MNLPQTGHEFVFKGDAFTLAHISDKQVRYTAKAGGRQLSIPLEKFLLIMESEDFEHSNDEWQRDPFSYDAKDIKTRNELFSLIRYVENHTQTPCSQAVLKPLLESYAKEHQKTVISASNFAKKYKRYLESGRDINCLIPRHRDKGKRARMFNVEQEIKVDEVLNEQYFTRTGLPLTEAYKRFRVEMMDTDEFKHAPDSFKRMSFATFRRRALNYDIATRLKAKHGKRSAQRLMSATGIQLDKGFPLENVEADGYCVDCHVVDEKTGCVLGRPYLTLFIDRATRAILSYCLSLKAFSVETLLDAFRGALREDNGLPGGRISNIIVDNVAILLKMPS